MNLSFSISYFERYVNSKSDYLELLLSVYFWYTFILLVMFVYDIFMTSPVWLAVGHQPL